MPTIKVNRINVYYEIVGQGEPLVLISGLGIEISGLVEHQNPDVVKKYRTVLIDNRGVGRTDKPNEPYTLEMMAEDVVGVMDALKIKRAHLLGISMGSRIALTIAAKYPERVNGLVLWVAGTRLPPGLKLMTFMLTHIPGYSKTLNKTAKFIFDQKYPPTQESFLRQVAANAQFDGRQMLPKIKAPTLIINGTKDQLAPVKYGRELTEGIAGAQMILVEGGDHITIPTDPELSVRPMLKFLAEVEARGVTMSAPADKKPTMAAKLPAK
ncbi:MAG TPA: alpha/beta hydrolase [Methanocella sp.]|nr:alpha/beta hydrolase [Methanocella sp.]